MISNTLIAFIYMTLKLFWAEVTDCKVTEYKKAKCTQSTKEERCTQTVGRPSPCLPGRDPMLTAVNRLQASLTSAPEMYRT